MKVMKTKRVSKIARGRYAKSQVLKGRKEKTAGGLTKDALTRNKYGKVVSKRRSAQAKKRYASSAFRNWIEAVKNARRSLHVTSFCCVKGKTAQGIAVYDKARAIYEGRT